MVIGLVRHFKVKHPRPGSFLSDKAQVLQWFAAYEAAELAVTGVDLRGIVWERCYSSPLKRARETARHLFQGEVLYDDALREMNLVPTLRSGWRLPMLVWAILVRIKSGRTNEHTTAFKQRIRELVDRSLNSGNERLLIVSYHFVMMELQRELMRRGFKGDRFRSPGYGIVYVLER